MSNKNIVIDNENDEVIDVENGIITKGVFAYIWADEIEKDRNWWFD